MSYSKDPENPLPKNILEEAKEITIAISEEDKVLVLIENPEDPLSLRARHVLYANSLKLDKLGYKIFKIYSNEATVKIPELACLRLPQLRLFKNKKLVLKHVGLLTEEILKGFYEEAL